MTELYTSNYPSSGYGSETLIREEFNKIETAFSNTVSKVPGTSSPNLDTDLDLGSNNIINVNNIDLNTLTVSGSTLSDMIQSAVEQFIEQVQSYLSDAQEAASESQASAESSSNSAADAIITLEDVAELHEEVEVFTQQVVENVDQFNSIWKGVRSSEPTVGEASFGSIYFNTNDLTTYVCYAEVYFLGEVVSLEWKPLSIDDTTLGTAAYKDATTTVNDYLSMCESGRSEFYSNTDIDGISLSEDGTKMVLLFAGSGSDNYLKLFTLSTPFDVTTMSSSPTQSFTIPTKIYTSISIIPDGSAVYFTGEASYNGTKVIDKYIMSTPWDITTIDPDSPIRVDTFNLANNTLLSGSFNSDGTYFTVMGNLGTEYFGPMSTPYDLSTSSGSTTSTSYANTRGIAVSVDDTITYHSTGSVIVVRANVSGHPVVAAGVQYLLPGGYLTGKDATVSSDGRWLYIVSEPHLGSNQVISQISISRLIPT